MVTDVDIYDCVVVGDSLAGAEAILRAARLPMRTAWLTESSDAGGLDSLGVILTAEGALRSDLFEAYVRSVLTPAIDLLCFATSIRHDSGLCRVDTPLGIVSSRALVYAPYGVESGLAWFPRGEALLGCGLTFDASSDAHYLASKRVAVVGSGSRAAEQAIVAAYHTESVRIVCDGEPRFGDLDAIVRSNPHIRVVREKVVDVHVSADRWVAAITTLRVDGPARDNVDFIVLASEPRLDHGIDMAAIPGCFPAGVAAGIPHHDRAAAKQSGRAAIEAAHAYVRAGS